MTTIFKISIVMKAIESIKMIIAVLMRIKMMMKAICTFTIMII